jgi:vancomycin permeability regulator SanA
VLVSGDGAGASGDETAAITSYLTERLGVDPQRVVADPHGLDTYDSCLRAYEVYGVRRALIVTQSYHLSRAVTLCRHVGIDADGVTARCAGCGTGLLVRKAARDYLASGKAAWDAIRDRPPAVSSPADPGVSDALTR